MDEMYLLDDGADGGGVGVHDGLDDLVVDDGLNNL